MIQGPEHHGQGCASHPITTPSTNAQRDTHLPSLQPWSKVFEIGAPVEGMNKANSYANTGVAGSGTKGMWSALS